MQSADYRQFCQLCQEGGVLDPLEICKTWLDRRNQRRLDELDEERSRAIGAQRDLNPNPTPTPTPTPNPTPTPYPTLNPDQARSGTVWASY